MKKQIVRKNNEFGYWEHYDELSKIWTPGLYNDDNSVITQSSDVVFNNLNECTLYNGVNYNNITFPISQSYLSKLEYVDTSASFTELINFDEFQPIIVKQPWEYYQSNELKIIKNTNVTLSLNIFATSSYLIELPLRYHWFNQNKRISFSQSVDVLPDKDTYYYCNVSNRKSLIQSELLNIKVLDVLPEIFGINLIKNGDGNTYSTNDYSPWILETGSVGLGEFDSSNTNTLYSYSTFPNAFQTKLSCESERGEINLSAYTANESMNPASFNDDLQYYNGKMYFKSLDTNTIFSQVIDLTDISDYVDRKIIGYDIVYANLYAWLGSQNQVQLYNINLPESGSTTYNALFDLNNVGAYQPLNLYGNIINFINISQSLINNIFYNYTQSNVDCKYYMYPNQMYSNISLTPSDYTFDKVYVQAILLDVNDNVINSSYYISNPIPYSAFGTPLFEMYLRNCNVYIPIGTRKVKIKVIMENNNNLKRFPVVTASYDSNTDSTAVSIQGGRFPEIPDNEMGYPLVEIPQTPPSPITSSIVNYNTDFESFPINAKIVANDPTNWNTWTSNSFGYEDALVSDNEHFYSGERSLKIEQYNNVMLNLGNKTTGKYEISFYAHTPTNHSGMINVVQEYDDKIGLQFHFVNSNTGSYLSTNGGNVPFNWPHDMMNLIKIIVNLNNDQVEVYINNNNIYIGTWSLNVLYWMTGVNKLSSLNFSGNGSGAPLFYIDDITIRELITYIPPTPPTKYERPNTIYKNRSYVSFINFKLYIDNIIMNNKQPELNEFGNKYSLVSSSRAIETVYGNNFENVFFGNGGPGFKPINDDNATTLQLFISDMTKKYNNLSQSELQSKITEVLNNSTVFRNLI
ncbi:MAG: hypothetical protein M0R17_08655 [Candidatus Omnitrophica bacterium]|jgi:hypothetical protein|nr:hypothetical protein [Candidatus Omnitrophota bacterium]